MALFHRVVDTMVDHYGPEMQKLEDRLDQLESAVFDNPTPQVIRQILNEKRRVGGLRRIITPQRDVMARLARRDFVDISTDMSFRFRDVFDHLSAPERRCLDVSGPHHRHPRRLPHQRQQQAE